MEKSEKVSKQYEQLSRQIAQLLRDFERNREWADIGNWLSRLQPVLAAKKHSNLPHKIQIAKRLAQCLNASLPAGIHSNTLSVYNTIFNNFSCKNQLLPLFSIGLFPFFEYSSSSLKIQLVKMFQTHYIKTPDCLQLITSLMNALLTGLNQNNEELAKKIYALCDKVASSYGRLWIDGAVWINILKSPKVRIAGFKYFMKTFKDRDKLKRQESEEQKNAKQLKQSIMKENKQAKLQEGSIILNTNSLPNDIDLENSFGNVYDSFVSDNNSGEGCSQLLAQLAKIKNMEDNEKLRFPSFSTLVVSALCQCLQSSQSDTLVRRATLDMMIFYLKLDNKSLISQKDGVHLVSVLLQTIKIRQYSLTRRVYTYLFGQPNTEGIYTIDEEQRKYQLYLLKVSLQKMFKISSEEKAKTYETNLVIIQILLKDHQKLIQLLLPILAYNILTFLRAANINNKRVTQFYQNVIQLNTVIFSKALQDQIVSQRAVEDVKIAKDSVLTIDYYYTLRHQFETSNKSQIPRQQILLIIQWLLRYLFKTNCSNERTTVDILELCNKLIKMLPIHNNSVLSQQSIHLLDDLISMRPANNIYAGLLTLHPHPSKQTLLPFMNEVSLSIVCITNLLSLNAQQFTEQEKKDIFFAIFKLLNCHLWEDQGIEFIKLYKNKYPAIYAELINKVQPSQWLIYWRKLGGDVDGGVIRMIKNLDSENHLEKQLSKKWLESSKQICSRVVDPVYKLMKECTIEIKEKNNKSTKGSMKEEDTQKIEKIQKSDKNEKNQKMQNMKEIYKMIQRIFLIQKTDFIKFFFLEKQRYFLPLIDKIFEFIYYGDEELKSHSVSMLIFLMERAGDIEEKLLFIETTIHKTIIILRKILGGKGNYERQIQIVEALISMVELFSAFKGKEDKVEILKKVVEDAELYETMAMGMKDTTVPYVRTLYIDFLQKSIQVFAQISKDSRFMSEIITCILEKLFLMLRESDVTSLQQIIKGKQLSQTSSSRRKKSQIAISIQPHSISQTEFNVEAKYAQIIELWNSVKFLVNVAIKYRVGDLPIQKLLSLILQSFPFSEIKYQQISPTTIEVYYEQLQQQIRNMTGLKKQVLQIFETLWQNYDNKIINFLIQKGDPRVLIHGSVDPTAVIKQITKSSHCMKIVRYFKGTKFSLSKNAIHYNTQILLIQNQINYFLYLYLLYCNLSLKNSKKVNSFIDSILNLVKSLKISTHCQTKIWILENLYCIFERIPFRDLHLENQRVKVEFQQITKQLIDELIYIVTKSKNFTHRIQIKTGLFSMFGKEEGKQTSLFDFVKIFPPTIHHMSQMYSQDIKHKKNQHLVAIQDFIYHFLFSKWNNLAEDMFIQYLSIASIKTLSKLFIPLLMNIYEQDIQKVTSMTRDWLLILFPLYENKSEDNQMYLETVAEFLHVLLNSPNLRADIIKNMRKSIIQIYMGNDFFKCTKNTLNNWKYIIDCCTENYDLLGQLLSREGLFEGIFTRKAESTRLKIKNFERVCFLIYSGRVDKYQNKLRVVLQSLNEVMKSQNPSPALLILILFCIRILVMRLSENSLNRMFRSFWPSLITLLIQIYTKQSFASCTNLLLAGLKVIELVHALELEEFNIHKWIFIFDYFGIRIDSQSSSEQMFNPNSSKILTPFKFKPIMTRVLPQNRLKCTFFPEEWPDQSADTSKRKIIVKQASIESDEQLRNHALILLQYMMDLNQRRVTVVKQQIEDLIEADFISLDDYIFQIK